MRPPVYAYPVSEFLLSEFLESDESPARDLPIFYNHYLSPPQTNTMYIHYNIEQLTRFSERNAMLRLWGSGKISEIWDYSIENCKILNELNIPCKHVPFTLTEKRLEYYKTLIHVKKEYDIGFCGTLSLRRQKIFDDLRDIGMNVLVLTNVNNEERDKLLAKCKMIINIHFADDYKIFERSRCEQWLRVGVPVISEESLDNDSRAICVPYDKLVETCKGWKITFCGCNTCAPDSSSLYRIVC